MKRSADNRRSPAEVRADLQQRYGELAEEHVDIKALRKFRTPPYYGCKRLIRVRGEQMEEKRDG